MLDTVQIRMIGKLPHHICDGLFHSDDRLLDPGIIAFWSFDESFQWLERAGFSDDFRGCSPHRKPVTERDEVLQWWEVVGIGERGRNWQTIFRLVGAWLIRRRTDIDRLRHWARIYDDESIRDVPLEIKVFAGHSREPTPAGIVGAPIRDIP